MRNLIGTFCFAAALVGCAGMTGTREQTVTLSPIDGARERGIATLIAQGDKTKVIIDLAGAPMNVKQPAHIHDGSCANLKGPRWPLNPVTEGTSTTEVPVPLSTLEQGGYAINVHKSPDEMATSVACGDIRGKPATDGGGPMRGY